jgi:ethanolamine ammonia-lyase small subunit
MSCKRYRKHSMLRSFTIARVGLKRVVVRYTTDALAQFNSSPSVYTATQAIKVQTNVGEAIDTKN